MGEIFYLQAITNRDRMNTEMCQGGVGKADFTSFCDKRNNWERFPADYVPDKETIMESINMGRDIAWFEADEFTAEVLKYLLEILNQYEANDLVSRKSLLAAYDAEHVGPPGKARELIVNAKGIL